MKVKDMIETLIKDSPTLGTFPAHELFKFVRTGNVNGIAVAHGDEKDLFLAIINGDPEGAIYVDDKGELFGDNAVMRINGQEQFTLFEVKKDFVDAVAMGCRVFDKSHLRTNSSAEIPEFGMKSAGIGNVTLVIQRENVPQNGIRVSIRKDGKIVGSDITTQDGSVGFRVMYGNYDCVLQDRNQVISTCRIKIDDAHPRLVLQL
jgi:hypothetical protein